MVVMDATTLLLLFYPSAKPPIDCKTGLPVTQCKDRIELLVQNLSKAGTKIIVPTPVLSEILVKAGPLKAKILNEIGNSIAFKIQPFDEMAAIELAMLIDPDLQSNKSLSDVETKAKVKFDRQIIAIAKVVGAKTIFSDDLGLTKKAIACGITVVATTDLSLPPVSPQGQLALPEPVVQESTTRAKSHASKVKENDPPEQLAGIAPHGSGGAAPNAHDTTQPAPTIKGEGSTKK